MGTSTPISRRHLVKQASKGVAALGLASAVAATAAPALVHAKTGIRMITPAALGVERDLYQSFIDEFQKAQPNISVNLTFEAWNDYMTKLPTLFAGGATPDVVHQHMSIVQDYGARGVLEDLGPLMQKDGIKQESYIPALFESFSRDGKVLGIPKDSAAWGVYYNKDKFDQAGLAYPKDNWTFDDFRLAARTLTIDKDGHRGVDANFNPGDNQKQWGLSWVPPGPTVSENVRGFVRARGGDWYDDKQTQTLITKQPALDHFQMLHDMRCGEHSTPSDALSAGQGDPFRQGLTAMAVAFHSMDYFLREEKATFKWDVTFIPAGAGGQFVPVGASSWALPAKAKNKDAAWELVKYLTSEDVQRRIGEVGRWGVSQVDAIATIIPKNPSSGFKKVHVDPLTGASDRTTISFKFPPNQSRIQQVYASHFDPIWTCDKDDIPGAADKTKSEVDAILGGS
ncbi:MAG: ABC transporter substrate-binding protein [Thermomicrobiales bacterium]